MKRKQKRIAILTAGGDCPGLNAAIRAVVKSADYDGIEVFGIEEGFLGLYKNKIRQIDLTEVSGILPRGGTFLKTSRFNPFQDKALLKVCLDHYHHYDFDGLIVIGGDGSLGIAFDMWREAKIPVIGIPKTIDNDIYGTDRTIGFYTAVQTVVDAIDKLHTTAESHNFIMVLEVMGRNCGYIAAFAGMAGGADFILVPEVKVSLNKLAQSIKERHSRGKNFSIVVVSEAAKLYDENNHVIACIKDTKDKYGKIKFGGVGKHISDLLKQKLDFETRYTNLGYVQRGGSPNVMDRLFATNLGCKAIDLVNKNQWGVFLAWDDGIIKAKTLSTVRRANKQLPMSYYNMAKKFFR